MRNIENYNIYQKEYQLKRYHRRRSQAIDKLGSMCVICSSIEELELDHINHLEKSFNIAKLWSISEVKFQAELSKCQLLCHKCHEKKTILERNHDSRYDHGTHACYRYNKCRCNLCKKAKAKVQREYSQRKRGGVG